MVRIDLNADLGEEMGTDDALLDFVSSASIACGGHAGSEAVLEHVLNLCRTRGVRAGAHPGFADKVNFGRVRLELSNNELSKQISEQLELAIKIALKVGIDLAYVKLHGALANMAAEDPKTADVVMKAIATTAPGIAVLALDQSFQVTAARELGLKVILEAYADRAYTADGLLVSRALAGAVIEDPEHVIERCVRLAKSGEIVAIDGTVFKSDARSICLHGDTAGAVELGKQIKAALESQGVTIAATDANL